MDYSRQGVRAKQKELRSFQKKINSKLWVAGFRLVIVLLVTLVIVVVMAGLGAFNGMKDTTPPLELESLEQTGFSSSSYFSDGTVAQEFAGAEANRKRVSIDEIPLYVQRCFVVLEDERFYEHSGIDVRGIMRAGYSVIKTMGLGYGASTITQQLIKNVKFGGGNEESAVDKITRKVQEQYLAIALENEDGDGLTKDQILEYYLNLVYLGSGAYGVEQAAETYFGKHISEVTLSEASVIAPIVLSTTYRNPITYPEDNAERRAKCLEYMLAAGYCSQEEYDEAVADTGVYDRIREFYETKTTKSAQTFSYFTDEVYEQVISDLQTRLGYSREQATNLLYYGGIQIYTTQDREMQEIMDKEYADPLNFPAFGFESNQGSCYELRKYALSVYKTDGSIIHYQTDDFINYFEDYVDVDKCYFHENGGRRGISKYVKDLDDLDEKIEEFKAAMCNSDIGEYYLESKEVSAPQPQSSMVIMDHKSGAVLAIVGGRGEKTKSRTTNRATRTLRQVGSTFKVLASFLPAIDTGQATLATVYDDAPFFYPGTTGDNLKEVVNWYNTGFRGLQSVRAGVYNSLNVVAVKNIVAIGYPISFEYLEKLGFTTLVRERDGRTDLGYTLALGGLTDGVTNLELTAAYASIANGGVYSKPYFYTKILDHDGNVLLTNEPESRQVMKTSTAWLLTSAMIDTTTIGIGKRLAFQDYKMTVAGKSGTSTGNVDFWFSGFTPYYTASIWSGFDYSFEQIDTHYQQNIWRKVMEGIHVKKELPYDEFEMPDSVVAMNICTKCGNLAVTGLCDEADSYNHESCVMTEYFAKGTVPKTKCTCHIRVNICNKTGKIATEYCPADKTTSVVLLVKNEEYEYTDEQIEELTKRYGEVPKITRDTPYVYNARNVCEKHLPKGYGVNKYGEIMTLEQIAAEEALEAAEAAAQNASEDAEGTQSYLNLDNEDIIIPDEEETDAYHH